MDFYLYLPSNTGDYVDNTLSCFKVKLPYKIDLDGEWEVALVELGYQITWLNISTEEEGLVTFVFKDDNEERSKSIPFNNYTSIDGLCDAINYTFDHTLSSSGQRSGYNFRYNSVRHRVILESDSGQPNLSLLKLSKKLQYMLGFKNQVLIPPEGKLEAILRGTKETRQGVVKLNEIKWSTKGEDGSKMVEHINRVLATISDGRNVDVVYRPDKSEITLHSNSVLYLKLSEDLQDKLGLSDDTIYANVKYNVKQPDGTKLAREMIIAEANPDIHAGQYSLFVYCNVVRPQIVGNTLAPILRAVSIRGRYGEVINELYDNPHYVPVLKKEFDNIEINISDDMGHLVNFNYGKVFVKLHFRMKQ